MSVHGTKICCMSTRPSVLAAIDWLKKTVLLDTRQFLRIPIQIHGAPLLLLLIHPHSYMCKARASQSNSLAFNGSSVGGTISSQSIAISNTWTAVCFCPVYYYYYFFFHSLPNNSRCKIERQTINFLNVWIERD